MGNSPKLNVILHGTFAYIDDEDVDFIDALIPLPKPDDGVDHVFRAGNWLGETELRPGTYKLEGVKPGADQLDERSNLIFRNGCVRRPLDPARVHARLIFPRPQKIWSLRLAKVDLKTRPPYLKGDQGAALQVFTYEIDSDPLMRLQKISDDEKEVLTGHYWEPVFTGNYASLHFFSAEDHPDDPAHTSRVFQATSALLGITDIELNEVHRARGIEDKDLPPGVIAEETEDLAARTLRIARLGRLRRQNADLNQAWYGNEALDGDPDACLSQACRR
jgi:hypothetical protein